MSSIEKKLEETRRKVDKMIQTQPDRVVGERYLSLEAIYENEENGALAESYVDEGGIIKLCIQALEIEFKGLREAAATTVKMDPATFNLLIKMRLKNNHIDEANKLKRDIESLQFAMNGKQPDLDTGPIRLVS